MATTISFAGSPDAVSSKDGTVVREPSLTATDFSNLQVPAGATVDGIVITWTGGYGNIEVADNAFMSVGYDGSGDSLTLAANETPAIYEDISSVTFGSSTQLWGLSWTPAQANSIFATLATPPAVGTIYHDSFQINIHFTPASSATYTISQGIIKLTRGKITLD